MNDLFTGNYSLKCNTSAARSYSYSQQIRTLISCFG